MRWDVTLGHRLWMAKIPVQSIVRELGVSEKTLRRYAWHNGWPKRKHKNLPVRKGRSVTKRCPRCLAIYATQTGNRGRHCDQPVKSIYLEDAAA